MILPSDHPTWPCRQLILVDTPGFDSTHQGDFEVLRRIAVWLADVSVFSSYCFATLPIADPFRYEKGTKVTGVVYLHDITQKRLRKSNLLHYEVFHKICGEMVMQNAVMATTHWDPIISTNGDDREDELRGFWKDALSQGAAMMRIQDPLVDSHKIIEHILCLHPYRKIRIQEEMVDMGKDVRRTEAGRLLMHAMCEGINALTDEKQLGSEELKQTDTPILDLIKDRFFPRRRPGKQADYDNQLGCAGGSSNG
ncbi:hypothetical protein H1R20_g6540, partial [Candolleomyces eurysporus]